MLSCVLYHLYVDFKLQGECYLVRYPVALQVVLWLRTSEAASREVCLIMYVPLAGGRDQMVDVNAAAQASPEGNIDAYPECGDNKTF